MRPCLTAAEVTAHVAGRMTLEEREAARAHVAACAPCASLVAAARQAPARASTGGTDEAPGPLAGRREATDPGLLEDVAIPGYEIVGVIRRGGQGTVYRAVQSALRRVVALKVLHPREGLTTRARQRFEREVDLVSGLQHPNVVAIHDGGVAGERPWIAMQLVEGEDLDAVVAARRLPIDEALRLFLRICAAVSHAHQRGVIHRDLKPANIRVDSSGQPHVLDFGVAKVMGGVPASLTDQGAFVGTISHAAPEQLRDADAVDVRTDVHALGTILFEMLAGRSRHDALGDLEAVVAAIRDPEPARPSAFSRDVDADLDTIVLTATAQDPERRYQSVDALSRDVERRLAGEPIEARRDSRAYVLRKTIFRYRVGVAASAAFAALLAGALLVVSAEREKAREAERLAVEQAAIARREADTAKAVSEFVAGVILQGVSDRGDANSILLRDALDAASTRAESSLGATPAVEARVLTVMARAYLRLGLEEKAEPLLRRSSALARDHETGDDLELARAEAALAQMAAQRGDPRAHEHRERALEAARRSGNRLAIAACLVGTVTGRMLRGLRAEAGAASEEALAILRELKGEDSPQYLLALDEYAGYLGDVGRLEEAEALRRRVVGNSRRVENPHESLTLAYALRNLASTVALRPGGIDESLTLLQEHLEILRRAHGPDHSAVAEAEHNLAVELAGAGRSDEALALARSALALHRRNEGEDHGTVGRVLHTVACALGMEGDHAAAADGFDERVLWVRAHHPDDVAGLVEALVDAANAHASAGHRAHAQSRLAEAADLVRKERPHDRIHGQFVQRAVEELDRSAGGGGPWRDPPAARVAAAR